jgi:AraC family transcriptional regulator, regulatory protein of adaptative response / methylated-DNA-[protein]-cysteine methyltransferase
LRLKHLQTIMKLQQNKEAINVQPMNEDYQRVERAILFLEQNFRRQPELNEVAREVGLSTFHFQRLFRRWAGISPKRFVQFLTLEFAKKMLENSCNLLDTSLEAGLSGPGRLHDLFVNVEAMTPGEFKSSGQGVKVSYGFHPSPFGECLVAATERGLSGLGFVGEDGRQRTLKDIAGRWKEAHFSEHPRRTAVFAERIFARQATSAKEPLTLVLKGTNFQIKVWEALLRVPFGAVTTYEDLAITVGRAKAIRAVGSAVGRNPISFLIPCHRVIRKTGVISHYHWGPTRKKAMLAWEAALAHPEEG